MNAFYSNVSQQADPRGNLILALLLCLFASSCKVGPNYATPPAKVAGHWPDPALTNQAYSAAEDYWWRKFADPVLDQLVETAFRNNLSLQIAGVRILEARAQLNKSIGNLFPQQQGISGSVDYSRLNDGLVTSIPGINPDYVSDQVLFAATWEIDFWGKYRRGIESDRAAYLGAIASYDDALVTLIADVASSYVNIRTLEERLRVARRTWSSSRRACASPPRSSRPARPASATCSRPPRNWRRPRRRSRCSSKRLARASNGLAVLLGETAGRN